MSTILQPFSPFRHRFHGSATIFHYSVSLLTIPQPFSPSHNPFDHSATVFTILRNHFRHSATIFTILRNHFRHSATIFSIPLPFSPFRNCSHLAATIFCRCWRFCFFLSPGPTCISPSCRKRCWASWRLLCRFSSEFTGTRCRSLCFRSIVKGGR